MSSGFSGTGHEFYTTGGFNGRSMATTNTPQNLYPGIFSDPGSQIHHRRPELIGKRSLAEFQTQQQQQNHHLYQQQQQQLHQLQQQQALGFCLRNIKQRTFQHPSPISPLSPPVDFSASISPDISSISSASSVSSRYGLPIPRQYRAQQPILFGNGINSIPSTNPNFYPKFAVKQETGLESEKKHMMNRLQELEKQLLDDDDDENDDVQGGGGEGDAVSAVTNSEWSETFQTLMSPTQKPISPSPTSSSSSCSSSASPPISCPKQSLIEAASAISEGKVDVAAVILNHLNLVSNVRGTSEQRLTAYMASALKSRVNPTEFPPPVTELYGKEHVGSTQLLYEKLPCFQLGFTAANLAILEATSQQQTNNNNNNNCKLHVVDFDIGHGGQYRHLINALAGHNIPVSLRITTFKDFGNGGEERLKGVGDGLKSLASQKGIRLGFNVLCVKVDDLSVEKLGVEEDEVLAVNLAFRLYKLPDESVTTYNLRDELLRGVKGLKPAVVTVLEQEMNGNTAPFLARVTEACGYYGALFDSVEATVGRENSDRVKIEEGLGRKAANSVACEGRDRVERCEVFGKWRARMSMAGFTLKPLSQNVYDSLRARVNSGFTVKEETGGICFGWMGRTLSVASVWR